MLLISVFKLDYCMLCELFDFLSRMNKVITVILQFIILLLRFTAMWTILIFSVVSRHEMFLPAKFYFMNQFKAMQTILIFSVVSWHEMFLLR